MARTKEQGRLYSYKEMLGVYSVYDSSEDAANFLETHPWSSASEVANGIHKKELVVALELTDLTMARLAIMDTKDKGTTKDPRYSLAPDFKDRVSEINSTFSEARNILGDKYRQKYSEEMEEWRKQLLEVLRSSKTKTGKEKPTKKKKMTFEEAVCIRESENPDPWKKQEADDVFFEELGAVVEKAPIGGPLSLHPSHMRKR